MPECSIVDIIPITFVKTAFPLYDYSIAARSVFELVMSYDPCIFFQSIINPKYVILFR